MAGGPVIEVRSRLRSLERNNPDLLHVLLIYTHMAKSDYIVGSQPRMMIHIVESRPLTKLADDGVLRVHSVDDITALRRDEITTLTRKH